MSEPKRYRKKPVVIEAMYFDGTAESAAEIIGWAASHGVTITHHCDTSDEGHHCDTLGVNREETHWLRIPTLEGEMLAHGGAHVIKGVANEFYPCKPDIFAATYDEVAQ